MPMKETVEALATVAGGVAEGDTPRLIGGVAPLESATGEDAVFADSGRALEQALATAAGCIVLGERADARGRTVIRARHPKLAFARIVAHFHPQARPPAGMHPTAVVDWSAKLGDGVSVGAHVVVGARAQVGPHTAIGGGCIIGDDVTIGADCVLHPRVTVYPGTRLGARVIVHSGAVLGSDGFGYIFDGERYHKFPQTGRLEIGDDVEIGANTTIDRAALGVTSIGSGTKLDNLVQIGHNVRIGEHCAVAALVGISGSVTIGDYVVMAGQVGIGDHAAVESGAVLGGQCGVLPRKTVRARETVWGTPARPIRQYLEQLATLARLARGRRKVPSEPRA